MRSILFLFASFMEVPDVRFATRRSLRAALGDQRLTQRLVKVIDSLGAKPNMSVPAATHGRAEMEAADRFFDNDKVSPEGIF